MKRIGLRRRWLLSTVVETVTGLVTPILDEQNFELVEVEFVKEGKNWFLRVFIDKEGGIDIEECAYVSEKLSEKLDSMDPDPIPQAYFLEVSSPGAERPLKKEADYKKALGEYINISLYQAVDGQKQYEGFLVSLNETELVLKIRIKTREKELSFDRKNIAKARLAIQF
ncbi:ribosome maturation factor rimP [Enterococcus dispar]|jgi:ribosome maturation factor RimP|nr:ribosome maturation factor rimP [Enterococcus dispar]